MLPCAPLSAGVTDVGGPIKARPHYHISAHATLALQVVLQTQAFLQGANFLLTPTISYCSVDTVIIYYVFKPLNYSKRVRKTKLNTITSEKMEYQSR